MKFEGKKINFLESSQVKEGVICDVYEFENDLTRDLGIVKVVKGYKTPKQIVLSGDKTIELYKSGTGRLTITNPSGAIVIYNFPSEIT